jgi:hypothetical protein
METCTLLVRLAGLCVFGKSGMVLHAVIQTKSLMGSMAAGNKMSLAGNPALQQIATMQAYAIAGLLIGLGAIIFAGPLARVLTFDAQPRRKSLLD